LPDFVEVILANLQKPTFLAETQSSPGANFLAAIESLRAVTKKHPPRAPAGGLWHTKSSELLIYRF